MKFPTRSEVEELREKYPAGTKVVLKKMDDFQAVPSGTKGVVTGVDDAGTIRVTWETGSMLGIVPGEDEIEIV